MASPPVAVVRTELRWTCALLKPTATWTPLTTSVIWLSMTLASLPVPSSKMAVSRFAKAALIRQPRISTRCDVLADGTTANRELDCTPAKSKKPVIDRKSVVEGKRGDLGGRRI